MCREPIVLAVAKVKVAVKWRNVVVVGSTVVRVDRWPFRVGRDSAAVGVARPGVVASGR